MDVKQAEAHIKTVYLYNFSKYIEWPAEYSQGSFIIGVINGGPALMAELNKMAATKTAGNQKFVVKNYQFVSDIDKCNILYVPETSNGQLQDILRKIRGYSTLLVTEYNGDAKKGATINFILKDSKQQFELNQANAEHCKLVVSNSLAALATKVD
jgi:hypothetical protein